MIRTIIDCIGLLTLSILVVVTMIVFQFINSLSNLVRRLSGLFK